MPISKNGMVLTDNLLVATKGAITQAWADLWQPSSRDNPDALFTRIYLAAVTANKVVPGERLAMKEFVDFVMGSSADVLAAAGLAPNQGDHQWAGVRVLRTMAIIAQAVYHPELEFTAPQQDMVRSVLMPLPDGSPPALQIHFTNLIRNMFRTDGVVEKKTCTKDPDNPVVVAYPPDILEQDRTQFDQWNSSPYGEERNGGSRRKTVKPRASKPAPKQGDKQRRGDGKDPDPTQLRTRTVQPPPPEGDAALGSSSAAQPPAPA